MEPKEQHLFLEKGIRLYSSLMTPLNLYFIGSSKKLDSLNLKRLAFGQSSSGYDSTTRNTIG